jgi:hypothetical protein
MSQIGLCVQRAQLGTGCARWWWDRGEVCTKNPDKGMIAKPVAIAKELKSRVVGDDGEDYA